MPSPTILIADDDPVATRVIAASLMKEGYQVITAMDAMQAVRSSHKSKPAAVVLDIMMPAGSGLDVLKKLRASTLTQLVPVIAMSSSADPGLPEQAKQLGAEVFLPKPVDLDRLNAALRQVLGLPAPGGQKA